MDLCKNTDPLVIRPTKNVPRGIPRLYIFDWETEDQVRAYANLHYHHWPTEKCASMALVRAVDAGPICLEECSICERDALNPDYVQPPKGISVSAPELNPPKLDVTVTNVNFGS